MANELLISYPTGATLYVQLYDTIGNLWNGSAFAAPGSANWLDYDIAMTEVATATGIYRASMPAAAAGVYGWTVRKQAGGTPAVGDVAVGAGEIRWTGTAEETVPASANVTLWKGDVPADLDASGNVLAKLANTVTHGGAAAQLLLKQADIVNPDMYGIALRLNAVSLGGKGLSVQSDDAQNTGLYARWPLAQMQDVADSMALAPTPGTPADGSVYDLLADASSGLTAQQTADAVNNLAPASTGATGSIRAKLDAIKLITDAIDTSAVTVTASNDAGVLTLIQAVTFNATVSGLTISGTWTKLWWTLKWSEYDDDDAAIVQLVASNPAAPLTDGLLYLDGAAVASPLTFANGALTVSQAAGTVAIAITDNATALLSKASGLVWDIKTKDAAGATVQNTTGTASITRAVTQTI